MEKEQIYALLLYRVALVVWLLAHLSWLLGNLVSSFHVGDLAYIGYFFQLHLARPLIGIIFGITALATSRSVVLRLTPDRSISPKSEETSSIEA